MKRLITHCYRFSWKLSKFLIFLIALFLLLARLAVNYVEDHATTIVDRLSIVLGVPVEVDSIDTEWRGLSPLVDLRGVRIGVDSPLSFDSILVKPDVISSLKEWTIAWSRFDVQGMDIYMQELPSGKWSVAGVELGGGGGSDYIEAMILESNQVSIIDSAIHITTLRGTGIDLELDSLELNYALGFRRLNIDLLLGAPENKLTAVAELTGDESRFFDLDGRAYANIDIQNLTGIYREILQRFTAESNIQIGENSSLKANFWANLVSDDELAFQGKVTVDDIPEQLFGFDCTENCDEQIAMATMSVYGAYSSLVQYIDIQSPQIELFGDSLEAPDFRLIRALNNREVDYSFLLPPMDIDRLMSAINKLPLPENVLTQSLSTLDPSGEASFVSLKLPNANPQRFELTGRVNHLNVGSYRGAPASRDVNVDFIIDKHTGLISVQGVNSGVNFPTVYDNWFECQSLSATVSWLIDYDNKRMQIASDDVFVNMDQGAIDGAFRLDTPLIPGQEIGINLTLALGMENADVSDHDILLPDSLPDALGNWLDKGLISGDLEQASVFYRGSLRKGESEKRTTQVRARVTETQVHFIDDWPDLENIKGELWVSDAKVRAQSETASLSGINLSSSEIHIDIPPVGAARNLNNEEETRPIMLRLSSSAQGSTNSALDLVRKTSLRNNVGAALDDLAFSGEFSSHIDLALPLTEQIDRSDLDIDISANIHSNSLSFAKQDLHIDSITGQVNFDSTGLNTGIMSAVLWDNPISIKVVEDIEQSSVGMDLSGEVDVTRVADWLELPKAYSRINGDVEFKGRIDLSTSAPNNISTNTNRYHFWSDLIGANIDLPAPFNKVPDQPQSLDVMVEIDEQIKTSVHLALDESLRDEVHHERQNDNRSEENIQAVYTQELVLELVQEFPEDMESTVSNESESQTLQSLGASLSLAKGENVSVSKASWEEGKFVANIALSELELNQWKTFYDSLDLDKDANQNGSAAVDLKSTDESTFESTVESTVESTDKGVQIFGLQPYINLEIDSLAHKDKSLGQGSFQALENQGDWLLIFETDYVQGDYQFVREKAQNEFVSQDTSEISNTNVANNTEEENGSGSSNAGFPILNIITLDVDLLKKQLQMSEEENPSEDKPLPIEQAVLLVGEASETSSEEALIIAVDGLSAKTELDPRRFPSLEFTIQSIVMDDKERGSWSGVMQSMEQGLLVYGLQGEYGSLSLAEGDDSSSFFWGVDEQGQFTELNLSFEYQDIGDLFRLTNVEPAMSSEEGFLYASLNWDGAPQAFSVNEIEGIMGFSAENGAFNTNDEQVPNALLKTIGLFNVGSWTRRLKFDFSDVASDGTPYDKIVGDFIVDNGEISTLTPVSVRLTSGEMLFDGNIDLNNEELDARLVITLPARQNLTWVAALVAGLPTAAGVWLVGQIFDDELDSLSSVSYRIEGTLDEPDISADRIFDSTIKQ